MEKGGTGIYMDAGVLLTRPIPDIYEIINRDGIFLLEDEQNLNKNWCHEKFVRMMYCKEVELNSKQLQAGILGWCAENQRVNSMFGQAYYYSRTRDILVGEKWNRNPINGVHGHRHDQSILSILSHRAGLARHPLNKFVTGTDYTTSVSGKYAFYHHRGNVRLGEVIKPTILPGIHEAFVINLDRREDRMKSFVEFHPYIAEKIKRHSATDGLNLQLTDALRHLFRNNDFQWKKSVLGCAISHNELWQQTADKKEDNHAVLILEDDVRFNKKWLDVWEKASKHIPEDTDIIYLGGILPPNKAQFGQAMTKVNEYFVTTKPNEVFSVGFPRKYFHCCNYSYILFARGARKLRKIIEEKGIFTSGDHMIVNHMETLNIHFLQPIVAGCFQDLDESYQKSMFNDFGRVDKFDSDLWNNTECFSIDEISGRTKKTETDEVKKTETDEVKKTETDEVKKTETDEVKKTETDEVKKTEADEVKKTETDKLKNIDNDDIMIEDNNLEGNSILMLLAKGKTDEVVESSINFLQEKLNGNHTDEKDYNWIRVIQQILMNQETKIKGVTRTRLREALNGIKIKTKNLIYEAILQEIIDKYDTKINEHLNGVMLYPNPASINTYPVWYFTPNQQNDFLEREWLDEIISQPLNYVAYGTQNINSDKHFLLIQKYSGQVQEMIMDKLNEIYKNKHHAILIHLSDEKMNDDIQLYGHPAVHLVLRNYIRSDIPAQYCDKVITLPLGYVNGRSMKGKYKKSSDRTYAWSFIGSVDKEGRIDMVRDLTPFEPNHLKLLSTWAHPTSETAKEFTDILEDSKFIPCPKGINFETFRLYEALEAGCIPICISSPEGEHKCYDKLVGNSAVLTVESWSAARSLMERVHNNNDIMNQIQENLTKFWKSQKMKLTGNILDKMYAMSYPVVLHVEEPLVVHL
jgi:GR25 family glycosyltransferase involved in LPS biosynthesis